MTRLLSSVSFYVALFLIIGAGFFYYASQRINEAEDRALRASIAQQNQADEAVRETPPPAKPGFTQRLLRPNSQTNVQAVEGPNTAKAKKFAIEADATLPSNFKPEATPISAGAQSAGSQGAGAQKDKNNVQIEFASASSAALEKLNQHAEGHLDIGRYSMAMFPGYKSNPEIAHAGLRSLAQESRPIVPGQPSMVFRGGKEPKTNEAIGLYVEVTLVKDTERGADYKISIKRSIPYPSPTGEMKVSTQNIDELVSIPDGAAVAMAGVLPRRPLVEGEAEILRSASILSVLADPGFQNGDEEFLIIINPGH